MKKGYFDKIFYHLLKMNKIKGAPGLLSIMGLSLNEIDNKETFKVMMVYPKIEYNLYAILR